MNITRVVTLHEGEAAAAVVRNHWLSFAGGFFLSLSLIVAPFFLMIPLFRLGAFGVGLFLAVVAVGTALALRTVYLWYWNAFIITTERVVDIDQRGLFDRTVSEAPYDKVQDVSYQIKGIIGTVLNVGTLIVQTAGTNTNLELLHVHRPQEIQHLIIRKMAARHEGQTRGERAQGLVAAAAEMSDTEARAFVTELQQAMAEERAKAPEKKILPTDGPVLPDDWREDGKEEDGPLAGWRKKRV